jgi:hypothetical protein
MRCESRLVPQLTDRDQPNHANLGRSIAGAGGARSGSGQRRLECRQRRRPSGVCHVLPEQPDPVHIAETQLTPNKAGPGLPNPEMACTPRRECQEKQEGRAHPGLAPHTSISAPEI